MNAIVIFLGRTLGRPSCKRLRDGSLFTAWGGGGRTKLEEMTSFLGEQKGGSVLRGIAENVGRIQRGNHSNLLGK